jgi:hypothetical protein
MKRPNAEIRSLSRLLYTHFIHSWLETTAVFVDHPKVIWALTDRPLHVLRQPLDSQLASWQPRVDGDKRRHSTATTLVETARLSVAMIAAFSGHLGGINGHAQARRKWRNKLWDDVVKIDLGNFLQCTIDEVRQMGWDVMDAILPSPKDSTATSDEQKWGRGRLFHRVFLEGEVVRAQDGGSLGKVLERAVDEAIKPVEIEAWESEWIVEEAGRVLSLLRTAILGFRRIDNPEGLEWIESGRFKVLPVSVQTCELR